ncbi:MAG: hypothetical protein GY725_02205 [bacterium]|nr:hypothetical protein [bacterium]
MTQNLPLDHARLPDWLHAVLVVAFGAATVAGIQFFADTGAGRVDLLLLGGSLGALVVAGLWITALGLRRSTAWGIALCSAILIPYLNFVIASIYVRKYWSEGGRAPALIAIAGMVLQTLASIRLLFASQPPAI